MNWYAIYTKPRQEDSVATRLQDRGIEVLNPKIRSKKFRRNKLMEFIEPLFPCYMFAHFEKRKYSHLIKYTRGVRYIIGKENPVALSEEIIHTIKVNMKDDNEVVIRPLYLKRGDKVRINNGPFKDFCGIFEKEMKGPERVMVLLDAIYYKLEIDSCLLTKVS